MSLDKFVGPATLIYLVGATFAAIWWASGIDRDVDNLNASTVTAERIGKLEVEMRTLGDSTRELKTSINELVRELKRNP